jgi:hypothetical protein
LSLPLGYNALNTSIANPSQNPSGGDNIFVSPGYNVASSFFPTPTQVLSRVLEFLLDLHLEDLIILAQVDPIKLETQVILSLLVFKFLLEANLKFGSNLKFGGNLKLGGNPKLGVITQCTGNISLDYNPNLVILLSKKINNNLGEKIVKLILLYPLLSLKFRPHMVTRTQHRQTMMKSFMDLN